MGRCHGPAQFMPSEYYTLAYDLDGDGRKRYLEFGGRCLGIGGQPAARQGLGAEPELGLRGAPAEAASPASRKAPTTRKPLREWVKLAWCARPRRFPGPCSGPAASVLAPAGALRPGVPGAREFPGLQALQHVRPLRAVRGQPRRPHRRRGRLPRRPGPSVRQLSANARREI